MGKLNYFSIWGVFLTVFLFYQGAYAQDQTVILPVLAEDAVSVSATHMKAGKTIILAQNTLSASEEDELTKDLEDEFDNTVVSHPIADPLYYFNYAMYSFNDFLYFAAIKPIANGYKAIVPTPLRQCVNNFFHNLLFPVRLVNTILQGRIKDAGTEVQIFVINTTIGGLGLGQVAQSDFDLHTSNEDLGQTLGSYSIGNGFYLVLPILGPSTLRDTVGLVGDYFLTPVNYVDPWELSAGIKAYDTINAVSFHIGDYEALKAAALDPYVAIKDAYIQNRLEKIKK